MHTRPSLFVVVRFWQHQPHHLLNYLAADSHALFLFPVLLFRSAQAPGSLRGGRAHARRAGAAGSKRNGGAARGLHRHRQGREPEMVEALRRRRKARRQWSMARRRQHGPYEGRRRASLHDVSAHRRHLARDEQDFRAIAITFPGGSYLNLTLHNVILVLSFSIFMGSSIFFPIFGSSGAREQRTVRIPVIKY